jgi:hypothetical protein
MDDAGPFVIALGDCFACGRPFTFHPDLVPSILFDGEREPVCPACMERVNRMRVAKGLDPHRVHPGAYGPGRDPWGP